MNDYYVPGWMDAAKDAFVRGTISYKALLDECGIWVTPDVSDAERLARLDEGDAIDWVNYHR